MSYKRGTDVLIEATFSDKDGNLYNPDTGTAKLFCKLSTTGVYLTGYDRATGGAAMTLITTGVYQKDIQFLLTDTAGQYEVEVEGFVGTKRSLDSLKIAVRA